MHFWLTYVLVLVIIVCDENIAANGLHVEGNSIVNDDGVKISLKGVNYFGFNSGTTMVDGLWGSNGLSSDFATVVLRQQLLGFNAVRLPFSFTSILSSSPPRSFLSQYCNTPTPEELSASVTPPGTTSPGPAPSLKNPPPRTLGQCNEYLPNSSTWDRFIWVIKFYASNGFYVLIDNHLREDQTAINDPSAWVKNWANLVKTLVSDPDIKNRLMIDILNEPDSFGIRWEASGGKPALKDLYINAMDAVQAVAPDVLFFIEGTGQGGIQTNWGDGFCTDPAVISKHGLSDPRPFFSQLLTKQYRDRVVLSPHIYPSSVTFNTVNATGAGLYYRLSTSFGAKQLQGYCNPSNNKDCQQFPVAVGEFGSKFIDSGDITMLEDLAMYFKNQGDAADGKHAPIDNWFYWSWNPNSGDTGGIVQDDWSTVIWKKVDYLGTIGLQPWYKQSSSLVGNGQGISPVSPPLPLPKPSPPPSKCSNKKCKNCKCSHSKSPKP